MLPGGCRDAASVRGAAWAREGRQKRCVSANRKRPAWTTRCQSTIASVGAGSGNEHMHKSPGRSNVAWLPRSFEEVRVEACHHPSLHNISSTRLGLQGVVSAEGRMSSDCLVLRTRELGKPCGHCDGFRMERHGSRVATWLCHTCCRHFEMPQSV